jgi:peroxiredoxin family protein
METTFDDIFSFDKDKAETGVPIIVGVNQKGDDVTIYVAMAGSERHEKTQRKYSKQLERARRNDKLTRKIMAKIVAQSLLIGWDGVLDKDGTAVEATTENKIKALMEHKQLYMSVLEAAMDEANFAEEGEDLGAEEDTEKN